VKTVVYTFESPATLALAKRLVDSGKVSAVVLQRPMTLGGKLALLRRRVGRHGIGRVLDELSFQLYYRMFLRTGDQRLRQALEPNASATRAELAKHVDVVDVDSLNSAEGQAVLKRLSPDLVVMSSRELLRPEVLELARVGFVGCHPGILPDFRGAYASFWAMLEGKPEKIGLSIYLAAPGIDTGPLVAERVVPARFGVQHFKVESERLILEGAKELLDVIGQVERGGLKTYTKPDPPGRLYSLVGLTDFLRAARR
jgi:folate-dependent phosphoribosylglycinamide formyltransferase PurN